MFLKGLQTNRHGTETGCILPFPKKGDLGLAKNYRGITLTSIAAKIYNALLRNRIEPKIDIILRKNQNGFRRNRSTTSQILTIRRILEGVRAKNLQATLIFVDFTKAFDSIHRGKMEKILLAYGIPKETVAAITILYRNTKVKVRSPDGDTEYFDIVAGVLQGDTLAPYLFIICLDYVLRTSIDKIKENGFELTKKRSRRFPATTITDADYADDIAILANTPDQAETLLHSLEQAAASIGLYVNAHKTEYMCYNQTGDIATLEGTPLKLVDKFTYLGSSVESTEKDIETRLTKAWTAINRLSIIWKSDLTDKMKRSFFQAAVTSILLYGCTTWTLTKRLEKKLDGNYTRMLRAILNKSWQQHPTRHQLYGHLPPITKTIQVRRTRHAGHCWRSRDELIRDVLLWIPTHGRAKAGRPARTYIQQLCEDTGCCPEDLPRAMNDREEWRERVRDIRATSAIWWWWWLHACQIVIHFDVLLFYGIVMHCFGAVMFMDLWGMFWALKILFFSWWNSPVTPGRNLLSEGLECDHNESRRNVLLEWPGSLGLWPGSGTRVWSFYGFEILQGIAEGSIGLVGWKMHPYYAVRHACQDRQPCKG